MNRLAQSSKLDTIATLAYLRCSESSVDEVEFSPAQALSQHVEAFIKERVLQNRSLKALSPSKVAVFCKMGGAVVSYSFKELSQLPEEEKERQIKDFYAGAIDQLNQNLAGKELTRESVLTVHTLFLQHLESDAAFLVVKGACSPHGYRHVISTLAPKLSSSNAQTVVKAHYAAESTAVAEDALMSFLFPVQTVVTKGKRLVKQLQLPNVITL